MDKPQEIVFECQEYAFEKLIWVSPVEMFGRISEGTHERKPELIAKERYCKIPGEALRNF